MAARGLFITFEGTDGSGKSTQIRRLVERLSREGYTPVETVEPGGTVIGSRIRAILLDPAHQELAPAAEMLLYFASRAQNVAEVILPALEAGQVVVCDRFTDSTLVYQGAGRGLGEAVVHQLHAIACGTLQPDLTLYLDIDLETGLARARRRNMAEDKHDESRMDEQSLAFHERVRDAYKRLAAAEPDRLKVVDAAPDAGAVEASVWQLVSPRLEALHG